MWDILDRHSGAFMDRKSDGFYLRPDEVAYNRATGEVVYYD